MRIIFFVLILFPFSFSAVLAQHNPLEVGDPAGKLIKMTERYFEIDVKQEPGNQLILNNYSVINFNKAGNRVEELEYDAQNKLAKKHSYENAGGKPQKIVVTDDYGQLITTIIYNYNENGLLDNKQRYNSTGKPEKSFVFKYDEDGLLRESYSYLNKGEFEMKYTYIYDYKNNIERNLRFTQGGNLVEERQYKYDQSNRIISELVKNEQGELLKTTTYQYVEDEKNNWIEKTVVVDKHPVKLIRREIVYK